MAANKIILSLIGASLISGLAQAEGPKLQPAKFTSQPKVKSAPASVLSPEAEKRIIALRLNEEAVNAILHGDRAGGAELLKRAIANDPLNPTFLYNLGGIYIAEGKPAEAVKTIQKAVELNPNDPSFHNRLAEAHFANSDLKNAAASYEKVLEINPKFPQAKLRLGTIYGMQQKFDPAEKVLRDAIELSPKDRRAYSNLASILIAREKYSDALEVLESSKDLGTSPEIELAWAVAYEGDKDKDEALAHYKKALELDPKNEEIKARIAELEKN